MYDVGTHARRSATVIGAGVGGLATGLALQQLGWRLSVRERSASIDGGGAGLVLWPNAVRCLRVLGVADAVQERATVLHRSALRHPDGRWLSLLDSGELARRQGAPVLGVLRADLVEVLSGVLRPPALPRTRRSDDDPDLVPP